MLSQVDGLPRGEVVPERLLLGGEPGASQVCAPPVCRLIGLLCSEMRSRVRRVPRVVQAALRPGTVTEDWRVLLIPSAVPAAALGSAARGGQE